MDFDLFKRVVDEAADFRPALMPQGVGESFIHPQWEAYLKYAARRQAGPLYIVTNGELLDERKIRILGDLGAEHVIVSLDANSPETHAQIHRHGNFERIEQNVRTLFETRAVEGYNYSVTLRFIRLLQNVHEIEDFDRQWTPYLRSGDALEMPTCFTWASATEYCGSDPDRRISTPGTRRCRVLWKYMNILWDGSAVPCCIDVEGQLRVGNARQHTIRELWTSRASSDLRRLHLKGHAVDHPVCGGCEEIRGG